MANNTSVQLLDRMANTLFSRRQHKKELYFTRAYYILPQELNCTSLTQRIQLLLLTLLFPLPHPYSFLLHIQLLIWLLLNTIDISLTSLPESRVQSDTS